MISAYLLALSVFIVLIPFYLSSVSNLEADFIRKRANQLFESGLTVDCIDYLIDLETKHGNLLFDDLIPSLYTILGVSLYSTQRVDEAIRAFTNAIKQHPSEVRAWINLGEIQVQTFALTDALKSFQAAFRLDSVSVISRILRTMGWSADWRNMEFYTAELELHMKDCTNIHNLTNCVLDSSSGMEYSDADRKAFIVLEQISPNARGPPNPLLPSEITDLWPINYIHKQAQPRRRLKVGFVSSDFGVHPVSSLIRGLIQFINKDRIELFCFSLQSKSSWWGMNISQSVEHFINIPAINQRAAAIFIAKYQIEILIDLNGHTMFSGLPIMSYRPAPLQMTFLGLPTTTGAAFIDYFLGDYVATPPELQSQFSEKLLLLPPSYIVNDYAQMQGEVIKTANNRAKRSCLNTHTTSQRSSLDIEQASILLATLSNSQKMSPEIFHVWMNILSALGGSQLVIMDYKGSDTFFPNLRNSSAFYGIHPHRLLKSLQQGWIDHLTCKTTLDLLLDTTAKNGHTTGLDGIWSGIPSLTFGGGNQAPARAAESMFAAMEMEVGVTYSLKEYEDTIYRLFHTHNKNVKGNNKKQSRRVAYNESQLLLQWRDEIHHKRIHSTLFDTRLWTRYFERFLEAAWEIRHLAAKRGSVDNKKTFHIFPERNYVHKQQVERRTKGVVVDAPFATGTAATSAMDTSSAGYQHGGSAGGANYAAIPSYVFDGRSIMLNIGGIRDAKAWLVVNNKHSNYHNQVKVDILRDMHNLYGLPDNSVTALYCSHTLEHNSHAGGKIELVLKEWFRVVRPGGLLMIAVPDLTVLSRMYLDPSFTAYDRYKVMCMIYGGQFDEGDFHYVGFDQETLTARILAAGFCDVERVSAFNLAFTNPNPPYDTITDSSEGVYKGYFISLNLVAKVCPHGKANTGIVYDGFEVKHAALPYLGYNQSAYMYR